VKVLEKALQFQSLTYGQFQTQFESEEPDLGPDLIQELPTLLLAPRLQLTVTVALASELVWPTKQEPLDFSYRLDLCRRRAG
jgi:hypothetical protein